MFHSLCPECGRALAPTEKDCPDCDAFGASALAGPGNSTAPAPESLAMPGLGAANAQSILPDSILPVFGVAEDDPFSLNTLAPPSHLLSQLPTLTPVSSALRDGIRDQSQQPDLGQRLPLPLISPAARKTSRELAPVRPGELIQAPLPSVLKLPVASLPVIASADITSTEPVAAPEPPNVPFPSQNNPSQNNPSQNNKTQDAPAKSYRFRLVPPAPVNTAPPAPVNTAPPSPVNVATSAPANVAPLVAPLPSIVVTEAPSAPVASADLTAKETAKPEPASAPLAPPDPPQLTKPLSLYRSGLTFGLRNAKDRNVRTAKLRQAVPAELLFGESATSVGISIDKARNRAPKSLPSFAATARKPGLRPVWLVPYRPSDRLLIPAGATPIPCAAQCQAVITPPSPVLSRQLQSFEDPAFRPVFPGRIHKKTGPLWMAGTAIGFSLLGIGFANLVTGPTPSPAAATTAAVRPATPLSAEPILSAPPSSSFAAPGSLARSIEVSGFRMELNADKKPEVEYIVVNHSHARLSGLTVYVTLHALDAHVGQPPLCQFSFVTPDLGVNEAKQMSSVIEGARKAISLPDWEDLRAEVQVGQ